jgi:hypothetical protein
MPLAPFSRFFGTGFAKSRRPRGRLSPGILLGHVRKPSAVVNYFARRALEHDAVRLRMTVESCSRFKTLDRVRTAKAIPLLLNAL